MIGLDSNILIRYLVQDDAAQARKVSHFIEESLSPESPGFINQISLCEIVWVLKRRYGVEKPALIHIIDGLLTTKQLVVENLEVAWRALRAFEAGNADFSDAMIACANQFQGCEYTVTFDRKASKLATVKLL